MSELDESAVTHMGFVQGVVNRLETSCFSIKALAMTFGGAVLGYLAAVKPQHWVYSAAAAVPLLVMWALDARYLQMGRHYRSLFDAIRGGDVPREDAFSMNPSPYARAEDTLARVLLSWSVWWVYLPLIVVIVVLNLHQIETGEAPPQPTQSRSARSS